MKSRQASREAPTPQAALNRQRMLQMTQTMHRAGVRFMAGTGSVLREWLKGSADRSIFRE